MRPPRVSALLAALGLATVAALHACWAIGSSWPASEGADPADTVAGCPMMPTARACWAVAATWGIAAGVTAGVGGQRRRATVARAGTATALLLRGVAGLTGHTHLLVPWTPSRRFVQLGQRVHGPACMLLGSLAAAGVADIGSV